MRNSRQRARAASLASALLILALGLTPAASAADHLDSPAVSAKGAADITDLYVFSAQSGNATVFVLGVNPGAGVLPNSGETFGTAIDYWIKVDTDADLKPDIKYLYRFGAPNEGLPCSGVRVSYVACVNRREPGVETVIANSQRHVADAGQKPLVEIDAAVLHPERIKAALLFVLGPVGIGQEPCRHVRSCRRRCCPDK